MKKNELTKDYSHKSILIKCYRFYRMLWNNNFKLASKIAYKITYLFLGCTIPPTAQLGRNVNFSHPIGIVIHQNAIIGDNTRISHNVTIGRRKGDLDEAPIIGSNCVIGTGACVLGKIVIGNDVKIGANAVVIEDIPSGCTVVGVPAKIVKREDAKK